MKKKIQGQRKTSEQIKLLNDEFQKNSKPNSTGVAYLVQNTGLTKRQIQDWFINQRKRRIITNDKENVSPNKRPFIR